MGVLSVLGLGDVEEQVYDGLVLLGSATGAELARRTGLPARAVKPALLALEERGLVVALVGPDQRWGVVPPEPALDALVHEQQQALARVRAHAQQLAQQARQVGARRRPDELVAVATGAEVVNAHFEQLQRQAQREVLVFDRPPYVRSAGVETNPVQAERIAAGVEYRTVYDRGILEDAAIFARVQAELAAGERGRVLADVPLKLAIADRTMALLPLLDADESGDQAALVIRPSVLLDSLAALFEALWTRAVPLRLGARSVPEVDPELLEVVELLATGMTDERIARHLGTSERTVRRRVALALQALGADTRFQAGLRAHQLGWLPEG